MIAPSFRFDTFWQEGHRFGRLAEDVVWQTEIKGYRRTICQKVKSKRGVMLWVHAELYENGTLVAHEGTEYDFGSGPAINNLPVIYASLKHDIGCHLTNLRMIAWKWRSWFDAEYRRDLAAYGERLPRRAWHWLGVSAYSQIIARWCDKA
jgi:hypothetical protein